MFVHALRTKYLDGFHVPVNRTDCYIDMHGVVLIVPDPTDESACFLHLYADNDLSLPVFWSDQFDSIKNHCLI